MKELLKTTYKNVKITEKRCLIGTDTYFETNLPWHSDKSIPMAYVMAASIEDAKKYIDDRLKELGIKKMEIN